MCVAFFSVLRYSVYTIELVCGGLLVNTLYDWSQGEDVGDLGLKCFGYVCVALILLTIQWMTSVALERKERRIRSSN